jgi:hypothetical protein
MSRLASISSNPVLKEFAQGAAQDAIMPVADFLAPTVPVATSVGRYKKYTEKNRFRIPQTLRPLGGPGDRASLRGPGPDLQLRAPRAGLPGGQPGAAGERRPGEHAARRRGGRG